MGGLTIVGDNCLNINSDYLFQLYHLVKFNFNVLCISFLHFPLCIQWLGPDALQNCENRVLVECLPTCLPISNGYGYSLYHCTALCGF